MQLIEKILKEYTSNIDVGKVLFGDQSKIARFQNKPYEENTDIETQLFEIIDQYIRMTNNKEEVKSIIPKLKKLKDKFPKILSPENKTVYRGTAVNFKFLSPLIKKYGYTKSEINQKWFTLKTKIDYKSDSLITSWTYNTNTAIKFAEVNDNHTTYKIIVCTQPDNSFILNPDFSNLISTSYNLGKEYETISMKNNFKNCQVFFERGILS